MRFAAVLLLLAVPLAAAPPSWKEIDRLIWDQKLPEALEKTEAVLAAARAASDEETWTKALVRAIQLRVKTLPTAEALRWFETEPWPSSTPHRAALHLYRAQAFAAHYDTFSWQINRRDRTEPAGTDLGLWTRDQFLAAILASYLELWRDREILGEIPVSRLPDAIAPNNYPAGVRGTLRDTASHLFAGFLAEQRFWTPRQDRDAALLDLPRLLEAQGLNAEAARLGDPAVHPLEKLAAVLGDLETWHAGQGNRAGALEARRQRAELLWRAAGTREDKEALRRRFEESLAAYRDIPWWSMAMATVADLERKHNDPDALARAHAAASRCHQAHPDSPGGAFCLRLLREIEQPYLMLAAMQSDGPRRRSIQVTHRNLPALYFRAYPAVLPEPKANEDREALLRLLQREPAMAWTAELPPTPDFRPHQTYVTPPLDRRGPYDILVSTREDFDPATSRIDRLRLTVTDLVLVQRPLVQGEGDGVEILALSGETGEPVAGAEARLYRRDGNGEHEPGQTLATGEEGSLRLPATEDWGHSVLVRKGEDVAWESLETYRVGYEGAEYDDEVVSTFVYTDRAIYRPGQKVLWKVLAYAASRRDAQAGRFRIRPGKRLEVKLLDGDGETAATAVVRTNEFGTASGELEIPPGKPLGQWTVASGHGWALVRVEEYKRPTFEVAVDDPAGPLRLDRPAAFTVRARYYFGLPVAGTVRWRVERGLADRWWVPGSAAEDRETVADGVAELRADGTLTVDVPPAAGPEDRAAWDSLYSYQITAEVTNEGGETREVERSFRVGWTTVEARITPAAGFFRAGQPAAVTLTRTSLDGQPRPGEGTWTLVALRQPPAAMLPADLPDDPPADSPVAEDDCPPGAYRTPGDSLEPRWTRKEDYAPEALLAAWEDGPQVAGGTVGHGAGGVARVALPDLPPGAYRLRYETPDDGEAGGSFQASRDFIVAGPATPLALAAALEVEQPSVPVGGMARLFVHSGLPAQTMFLEIYHGGRLTERRRLRSGQADSVIELPVRRRDRGGFGVRLLVLRDHQLLELERAVRVPWDDRHLEVELASFRDRVRPGGRETWRVSVRGTGVEARAGEAAVRATAEILASMYDRSLDVFASYEPPDPFQLYPDRSQVPWMGTSLGDADSSQIGFGSWTPDLPAVPSLWPDQLQPDIQVSVDAGGFVDEITVTGSYEGLSTATQCAFVVANGPRLTAPPAPPSGGILPDLRRDFSETAFWLPHLRTGPDGSAAIEFTVPDSVTAWSVWVHALTRDLRVGSAWREVRSARELMVRPYLPRFLREGDQAAIKVVVDNAAAAPLAGEVVFDILDPETGESRLAEFGIAAAASRQPFSAASGAGASLTFPVTVPRGVGEVHVRVTATAGGLSDGELRPLPVLPSRLRLTQSRFAAIRGESRTLRFEELELGGDPTRENEQLVVTVDGQLFYGVLAALPYLVDYPYECTEQTLNRFLSTGIVTSLFDRYPAVARMAGELSRRDTAYEAWDPADPNRKLTLEETPWLVATRGGNPEDAEGGGLIKVLDPRAAAAERKAALERLGEDQLEDGAFPWWSGGPASPGMTLYLLHGFAKAVEHGVEIPKPMVQRAWGYLGRHYQSEYAAKLGSGQECCWHFLTFLNYVATAFPDASWAGEALPAAEQDRLLDASFRHWREHPPYLRGMLALTLKRRGRADDARRVFASLMDASRTTPEEGTFWAPQGAPWLWYHDSVEGHAFLLRALMEIAPEDPRRHGMVQWLFLNKHLNHWKSTRATAEALYALVHYLDKEGQLGAREAVKVSIGEGKAAREESFVFEPDRYTGKQRQVVVRGEELDPARSAVTVDPETSGLLFASATWHFSTDELPKEGSGDLFAVSRRYFRRVREGNGSVLHPLAEGTVLEPGDEVEVQLTLTSRAPAEYVHLRDPRPAGFEPGAALSGDRWGQGLGYYEETRDSGANFFIERLPAGEYTLRYRVRANVAGTFRSGPATLQSMYAPEFAAYSAGEVVRIEGQP